MHALNAVHLDRPSSGKLEHVALTVVNLGSGPYPLRVVYQENIAYIGDSIEDYYRAH